MRISLLAFSFGVLAISASPAHAAKPQPLPPAFPAWSPAQATNAPDAKRGADDPKAWATALADGGAEWLAVTYKTPVLASSIHIVETLNPGAVTRVVVTGSDGEEQEVWQGTDPTKAPGGTLKVPLPKPMPVRNVRVELDTARVPGWNEIDAVGLRTANGKIRWADAATASSYYGASTSPFARLLGRDVTIVFDSQTQLKGQITAVDAQTLTLLKTTKRGSKTYLVPHQNVLYVETTP